MYIIIKNENSRIINNLTVNVSKTLVGDFTREDLDRELFLVNYDKAIVDITSITNYYDDNYLYSFLEFFRSPSDVILLLNDGFVANSKHFLSKLISKGYYNFATTDSAVNRLLERNNTIDDVKEYMEGYDFLKTDSIVSGIDKNKRFETDKLIIGIENGFPHSGATTLMYMLVKEMSRSKKVKGIEMISNDSLFFKDDRIISCESRVQLETIIKTLKDIDIYVVDLNGSDAKEICNKVIYLIEPGITKINKVVKGDRATYERLMNANVVLNRSNIKDDEMSNLEYETKFKIVGNIPNLNERLDSNEALDKLVNYLIGSELDHEDIVNDDGTINKKVGLIGFFKNIFKK